MIEKYKLTSLIKNFHYSGETVLHKAYLHRNFKIAAYLETCGADTLIKNKHGKTPAEVGQDYADTRGVYTGTIFSISNSLISIYKYN